MAIRTGREGRFMNRPYKKLALPSRQLTGSDRGYGSLI